MNILMAAAENAALPSGKVGGIGDVLRDLPPALCELGHKINVLMPGYQHFSTLPGARQVAELNVNFRGEMQTLGLFRLQRKRGLAKLQIWIIDHQMLAPMAAGQIYCDDADHRPFATDASKFALFCIGSAQAIIDGHFGPLDAIHLHDWHTALIAVLAHYHPQYQSLKSTPLIYTIHNLGLQGVRPFSWDESALENWYRQMPFDYQTIRDPYYDNCYNPMRAAINLCDKVHAVSPNYVVEIQQPSDPSVGFIGGEGLHVDLQDAAHQGRLIGILNGCEYPEKNIQAVSKRKLISAIKKQLKVWSQIQPKNRRHAIALRAINRWEKLVVRAGKEDRGRLLTSVGRITDQKVKILLTTMGDTKSALAHLLNTLEEQDCFILLGSGQDHYETLIEDIAAQYPQLIFLCGYSDKLADALYASGDLFVMPSSFEPCGISQMLAMRSMQPCLVHHVGGLVDTVTDGVTGFAFTGETINEQAENMLARAADALQIHRDNPKKWEKIKSAAGAVRFQWTDAADEYVEKLYRGGSNRLTR